jgi:hypothetical protein
MKTKLNKVDNGYVLLVDNIMYATDNDKLSKQNCDEIFGVVDVEKLVREHSTDRFKKSDCPSAFNQTSIEKDFIRGFNKAMELNKDKLFTLEDVKMAYIQGFNRGKNSEFNHMSSYIQFLQQPTEIDVEIKMECPQCQEWGYVSKCRKDCNKKFLQPKLDSDGCLILKRI